MLKKLLCTHDYKRIETIHGDEIIGSGFKRSIWKCSKCNKNKASKYLDK